MTEQQFCYWLQGFAELSGDCPPTPEQWKSIREHLALCFKKVTPPVQKAEPMKDALKEYLDKNKAGPGQPLRPAEAWPPLPQWPQQYPPNWMESGKVTITC